MFLLRRIVIPRVLIKEFKLVNSVPIEISGKVTLTSFSSGMRSDGLLDTLDIYSVVDRGVLSTALDSWENILVGLGSKLKVVLGGNRYCKWHDKSIDDEKVMERRYCKEKAVYPSGFCRKHLNSDKHFYVRCFMINDPEYKLYCGKLDEIYNDKIKYVVYLQITPALEVKVGVTREKRFLERLSEQPHLAGIPVLKCRKAVDAREAELFISGELGYKQISRTHSRYRLTTGLLYEATELLLKSRILAIDKYMGVIGACEKVVVDKPVFIYKRGFDRCSYIKKGLFEGVLAGFQYNNILLKFRGDDCFMIGLNKVIHRDSIILF